MVLQVIDRAISTPFYAGALFVGMLLFMELGRRIGARRLQRDPDRATKGLGTVEAALFGFFALLVAFTFSAAASRFEVRRAQIVDEANAISTAYERLDLLTPEAQPALRELFRAYLESRLTTYRRLPDIEAALREVDRSSRLYDEIWTRAVAAIEAPGSHRSAVPLVPPALNEMSDLVIERTAAGGAHTPTIILWLLFVFGLICGALAGHGMAAAHPPPWGHMLAFALGTAITAFVILDLEYPRTGRINLEGYDQVLVDLLETMKSRP